MSARRMSLAALLLAVRCRVRPVAQQKAPAPTPAADAPKITDQDFTPSVYTYEVGGGGTRSGRSSCATPRRRSACVRPASPA